MPRRKPGTLLPLEKEILRTALSLRGSFHGFGLAHAMREQSGSRALTAHGTLYKALGRLEERGLLTSVWEDGAAAEGRPRRRLYELTGEGARVARAEQATASSPARRREARMTPERVARLVAARRPRSLAYRAAGIAIGVAACLFGDADDAPGLVLFGCLLIGGTLALAVRTRLRSQ